jgi:hypothetical protein
MGDGGLPIGLVLVIIAVMVVVFSIAGLVTYLVLSAAF